MASATVSSSSGSSASQSSSASTYSIPAYPEESLLDAIATASANLAPQLYQWAQTQYNKGQSLADQLEAQAQSYASPTRIASDMGAAESGAAQGIDAARTNALQDLQSYGIDPSAGRFAGLDRAAQVQKGAAIAGAGNQQRLATEATGRALGSEAANVQLSNENIGNALMNTPNAYLGTAMRLNYPPLGQTSTSDSSSASNQQSSSVSTGGGGGGSGGGTSMGPLSDAASMQMASLGMGTSNINMPSGGVTGGSDAFAQSNPYIASNNGSMGLGSFTDTGMMTAATGGVVPPMAGGGYVPPGMSPSGGQQVDDVPAQVGPGGPQARINAGEFVIPRDVVNWNGNKFYQDHIVKSRKAMQGGQQAKPQMRDGAQHMVDGGNPFWNDSALVDPYGMMNGTVYSPGWYAGNGVMGDIPGSPGAYFSNPQMDPHQGQIQIGPSAWVSESALPGGNIAHVSVPSSQELLQRLQAAARGNTAGGVVPHFATGGSTTPAPIPVPSPAATGLSKYFTDPNYMTNWNYTPPPPAPAPTPTPTPGGGGTGSPPTTSNGGWRNGWGGWDGGRSWNGPQGQDNDGDRGGFDRFGGGRGGFDRFGGGRGGFDRFGGGRMHGERQDWLRHQGQNQGAGVVPPTPTTPTTPTSTATAPSGPSNVVNGIDTTTGGVNTGPRYGMTPTSVVPQLFTGVSVDTPTSNSFFQKGFV
jgi:hypothetical protein